VCPCVQVIITFALNNFYLDGWYVEGHGSNFTVIFSAKVVDATSSEGFLAPCVDFSNYRDKFSLNL